MYVPVCVSEPLIEICTILRQVTKSAFDDAAKECKLDSALAEQLWAKLASTSTQRIIGGASAPREDGAALPATRRSSLPLVAPCLSIILLDSRACSYQRQQLALVGAGPRGVGEEAADRAARGHCCGGRAEQGARQGDEARVVHRRGVADQQEREADRGVRAERQVQVGGPVRLRRRLRRAASALHLGGRGGQRLRDQVDHEGSQGCQVEHDASP